MNRSAVLFLLCVSIISLETVFTPTALKDNEKSKSDRENREKIKRAWHLWEVSQAILFFILIPDNSNRPFKVRP